MWLLAIVLGSPGLVSEATGSSVTTQHSVVTALGPVLSAHSFFFLLISLFCSLDSSYK